VNDEGVKGVNKLISTEIKPKFIESTTKEKERPNLYNILKDGKAVKDPIISKETGKKDMPVVSYADKENIDYNIKINTGQVFTTATERKDTTARDEAKRSSTRVVKDNNKTKKNKDCNLL